MFSLAAQSSSGTSWVILIVVYAVIFGGFYMIFMRPQKKEQKRVQAMINEMEVGDTVLTTGGFYGVLIDISDEDVIVEFGSNKNFRIPMQKAAIAKVKLCLEKCEIRRYCSYKYTQIAQNCIQGRF